MPNASTLKNDTNSIFLMITASGTEAVIMKNLVSRALATVAVMCLWLQKCYQWFEKQYETPSSKTVELVERITNLLLKQKSDFRKKSDRALKEGGGGGGTPY